MPKNKQTEVDEDIYNQIKMDVEFGIHQEIERCRNLINIHPKNSQLAQVRVNVAQHNHKKVELRLRRAQQELAKALQSGINAREQIVDLETKILYAQQEFKLRKKELVKAEELDAKVSTDLVFAQMDLKIAYMDLKPERLFDLVAEAVVEHKQQLKEKEMAGDEKESGEEENDRTKEQQEHSLNFHKVQHQMLKRTTLKL